MTGRYACHQQIAYKNSEKREMNLTNCVVHIQDAEGGRGVGENRCRYIHLGHYINMGLGAGIKSVSINCCLTETMASNNV